MKILGLSCGREMDNTEVLVKEALMAAEEAGAEVGFIRVADLDIQPCRGCTSCLQSLFAGGPGNCVIADDMPFLDEHLMQCDGLILGSPVYTMTPAGSLKILCERFGPSHDVAFRLEARKIAAAEGPDERSFKDRAGAFISVGGGADWVAMALPLMNLFTFPLHITVVDQMQLTGVWYGSVTMDEGAAAIARARRLGLNVAETLEQPVARWRWRGEETGTCPVCHSDLLRVTDQNPVECPICGIKGRISLQGDRISVDFPEEEQRKSRLTLEGLQAHWFELQGNQRRAKKKRAGQSPDSGRETGKIPELPGDPRQTSQVIEQLRRGIPNRNTGFTPINHK
jgi:multimeric flavodoxin WrbA